MSEPLHGKLLTSALSAAAQVSHRYPIDLLQTVETQVEQTFAAKGRKALLTKGVDDAIDSVLRLHSQATPFVFRPTFSGFFERFRALGIPFESIALDHRHEPPTLGITSPVSGKFFFLANPNNPTGTVWPSELIIEAAQQAEHIFLDETYIDFSRERTFEIVASPNTLLFRSFSKACGLAGARLGVLTGSPSDIEALRSTRGFCPIDVFSLHVLGGLLESGISNYLSEASERVITLREQVRDDLRSLGFTVPHSSANFLVVHVGDSSAALLFLSAHGILVRDLMRDGLPGWLRISIGTKQDMSKLTKLLVLYRQTTAF